MAGLTLWPLGLSTTQPLAELFPSILTLSCGQGQPPLRRSDLVPRCGPASVGGRAEGGCLRISDQITPRLSSENLVLSGRQGQSRLFFRERRGVVPCLACVWCRVPHHSILRTVIRRTGIPCGAISSRSQRKKSPSQLSPPR
jgi:hypothetical protein